MNSKKNFTSLRLEEIMEELLRASKTLLEIKLPEYRNIYPDNAKLILLKDAIKIVSNQVQAGVLPNEVLGDGRCNNESLDAFLQKLCVELKEGGWHMELKSINAV